MMHDATAPTDLYEILGVKPGDGFHGIKRAYYRRAKQCHPDRFGGDRGKEEEFKRVLAAFDILSDPLRRRQYDARRGVHEAPRTAHAGAAYCADDDGAIMDCFADDTLEELIVGNHIPRQASLRTLMLDLENTERFCRFREAKNLFHSGHAAAARGLLSRCIQDSPHNILYRYYLAKSHAALENWHAAEKELKIALQFGALRHPPLRLNRIRRELDALRGRRARLLAPWRAAQHPSAESPDASPEEVLARRVGRTMDTLVAELERRKRRKLPRREE